MASEPQSFSKQREVLRAGKRKRRSKKVDVSKAGSGDLRASYCTVYCIYGRVV